jgi:hypothetical protein
LRLFVYFIPLSLVMVDGFKRVRDGGPFIFEASVSVIWQDD